MRWIWGLLIGATVSIVGLFWMTWHQHQTPAPVPEVPVQEAGLSATVSAPFGLPADSFEVYTARVQRNENLADMLLAHEVPYAHIHAIAEHPEAIFDVRKIQAGDQYRIFFRDSTAHYFVYEPNPVDYIVVELGAQPDIYRGQHPVTTQIKTAAGVIDQSLYVTLDAQDVNPQLAIKLSEVFAWQINFFGIQAGDRFKVIYEERFVGGQSVGLGAIQGAYFYHRDKDFYAFGFAPNDTLDYFDETGGSLRKAFLRAPVQFKRISSRYTRRRFHPVQRRYKAHLGTDFAANPGTPIYTTGDGVVIEARYTRSNGNYVKVRHNGTYTTQYLHMSKIASGMRPGVAVSQGQVIGYVGSTGLASGPHVCYRFWKNGVQVDPFREEFPPSEPLAAAYTDAFAAHRQALTQQLLLIPYPNLELTTP